MSGKPNSPLAQLLQQAFLALRAKQFDIARQLATEALKSNRTDRNAVLILAHALLGQERAEEAIAPLEKAAKRNSDPKSRRCSAMCCVPRGAEAMDWRNCGEPQRAVRPICPRSRSWRASLRTPARLARRSG
ncbi:tetratricopeptide (TPR) repeat protein [Bradyrhizobium barranii subsp. barranii]